MQSKSVGEHEQEVVFRDGVSYFHRDSPANERTPIPRDLIRDPPEWVRALLGKSASVSEFLAVMGARALDARTVEQRKELFTVFEQFAQWGEGRNAADLVLGPDFIYKLTLDYQPGVAAPAGLKDPAIIVSADPPLSLSAWLNPWQDEFVWPERSLKKRWINRTISKVWLNNWRPFVELFLFDGPDLQGRLARFARVWTPNGDLPIELDGASLRGQARSLLGGEFNTPGRRFSASARLTQAAEQSFAGLMALHSTWGTATLTRAPQFSWDGYDMWLKGQDDLPVAPKIAALRVRWDFQIEDVDYGIQSGSVTADLAFHCPGGSHPIESGALRSNSTLAYPWAENRWLFTLLITLPNELSRQLGPGGVLLDLAGSSPNSMLVLPGDATAIPQAPPTQSTTAIKEVGQTTDDATIVFFP